MSYNKRILDLGSWGEFCPFELYVFLTLVFFLYTPMLYVLSTQPYIFGAQQRIQGICLVIFVFTCQNCTSSRIRMCLVFINSRTAPLLCLELLFVLECLPTGLCAFVNGDMYPPLLVTVCTLRFVESVEDTIPDDFERECAELPEEERTDLTHHSDEDMEAAQRRNHRPRGGNVME